MVDRSSGTSLPQGIRLRDGAIEINFTHNKQRQYITLPHPANAEGINAAHKIRSELKNKANWGILTEHDIAVLTYDQLGHGRTISNAEELGYFAKSHPMQKLLKDVCTQA